MTQRTRRHGLRAGALAAAAMALAGCAADYVGEDWQCPLAQGSVCASVAAADPAIPATRAAETHGSPARITTNRPGDAPPYRPRTEGAATVPSEEGDCASACNPFAWLAGLFGAADADAGTGDAAPSGGRVDGAAKRPETLPGGMAAVDASAPETSGIGLTDTAAEDQDSSSARPEGVDTARGDIAASDTAPLPARDVGPNEDPRAPETVARVWIAPWVDTDGIYREGSWVRAVIAPAEWRLR